MKIKPATLAGILFALACTYHLPAQPTDQVQWPDRVAPEPVNLDIPPVEIPDPDFIREQELAVHAVRNPDVFHELLLQLEPDRSGREERSALAILNPGAYRRVYPPSPEQIRAEALARHAILNPRFPVPSLPNRE